MERSIHWKGQLPSYFVTRIMPAIIWCHCYVKQKLRVSSRTQTSNDTDRYCVIIHDSCQCNWMFIQYCGASEMSKTCYFLHTSVRPFFVTLIAKYDTNTADTTFGSICDSSKRRNLNLVLYRIKVRDDLLKIRALIEQLQRPYLPGSPTTISPRISYCMWQWIELDYLNLD